MSGTTTTTTTTIAPFGYNVSIIPDSGYFGYSWPANGAMPTSFSSAGWSLQDRGFVQQTFLGASIRSFTMNGGFGDSSSSLSVELVNDEFNRSDSTGLGDGDDPYHGGSFDMFSPPPVGSPVFFKFGMNLATVEEAYRSTFDQLYNMNTFQNINEVNRGGPFNPLLFINLPDGQYIDFSIPPSGQYVDASPYFSSSNKGRYHTTFGGILQSYTQNRGPGGSPIFSAQIVDPREILSNVTLILNNYAGTVFSHKNILNIYGFLEYNPSDSTLNTIKSVLPVEKKLKKEVSNFGSISYTGDDTYTNSNNTVSFPMTGTGFSRRGQQGIPYYRIKQAINSLMEYNIELPPEYKENGFGGAINFRGHNYIVDFGSLPDLPGLYYIDFDQISLLELALEICDITSRDLFVTLLPVINHPACAFVSSWNERFYNDPTRFISGIIRLDSIDRSKQPYYGAIKFYIDSLASYGIHTQNQDIGFELSNIVTDKFIVGAQEVDMHYFSSNADRNRLKNDADGDQWTLESSFKQQILPYYGLLGNSAVTIPKGYGSYQQILLDATSLNANGVGSYYVTTEMELRCSLISYDRWKEFLQLYNDIYMESMEDNDVEESLALLSSEAPPGHPAPDPISNNYAVTVPRSVFPTYASKQFGDDKLPFSPCNPPYGYPLYYKRMTKIGIPEGGLVGIQSRFTSLITGISSLKSADKSNFKHILNSQLNAMKELMSSGEELNELEQKYLETIEDLIKKVESAKDDASIDEAINIMESIADQFIPMFYSPDLCKVANKNIQNALKVYNFVRGVAEECLGKKFLVKIPKNVNPFFTNDITVDSDSDPTIKEYKTGPFGFRPRPVSSLVGAEFSRNPAFINEINLVKSSMIGSAGNMIQGFLSSSISNRKLVGELNVNLNTVSDQYEFNYTPMNEGGFFDFDLYRNVLNAENITTLVASGHDKLPRGVQNQLIPIDLTNFINDNGRVSCYVRFDHSENLSFEGFSASDFSQQTITANGMIPDVAYDLDNTGPDNSYKFENRNNDDKEKKPEQVAFVKCQVDEKLYMPPKTSIKQLDVYGAYPTETPILVPPRKIYKRCEDIYVDSFSYYKAHFHPGTSSTGPYNVLSFNSSKPIQSVPSSMLIDGEIINTKLGDLDTDHVYALITLPGRIVPTKDSRFRDGPFQSSNAEKFKHMMLMDTVKGLPGFDTPGHLNKPATTILKDNSCSEILPDTRIHAWLAAKKSNDSALSFALPQRINLAVPSPVYPDLVALPLMSKDRCYGPWISSQLDIQASLFTNIGGKIEFIKDENLSPWNYAGYDLMNNAGILQAQFSNSLMLASERGGFVVPYVPVGVTLGRALLENGPIITSMQVDVSEAGVSTTYKLDLYTSSFGKLQKQKQDEISKMSRERQRLKDERNALIRKGIGKNQTSLNYLNQYDKIKQDINSKIAEAMSRSEEKAGVSSAPSTVALSVNPIEEKRITMSTSEEHTVTHNRVEGSIVSYDALGRVMQNFVSEDGLASSYQNSAVTPISEIFTPASNDVAHPHMAARLDPHQDARRSLYFIEELPFSEEDIV